MMSPFIESNVLFWLVAPLHFVLYGLANLGLENGSIKNPMSSKTNPDDNISRDEIIYEKNQIKSGTERFLGSMNRIFVY